MKDLFEREKGILRRFFSIILLQISIYIYIYIFDEIIVNKFMIFKNSVIYYIIYFSYIIWIIMFCLALFYLLRRILANVKYFKIHFPKIEGEVDELKTLRNYYVSQQIWCFTYVFVFIFSLILNYFDLGLFNEKLSKTFNNVGTANYILLMFSQWRKIKEIKKHISLE